MLTSILASNLSGVTNVFAAEGGYEQTVEQDAQGSAVGSTAESETAAEKEPAASVIENTEEASEELSVDPDTNDNDVQDETKEEPAEVQEERSEGKAEEVSENPEKTEDKETEKTSETDTAETPEDAGEAYIQPEETEQDTVEEKKEEYGVSVLLKGSHGSADIVSSDGNILFSIERKDNGEDILTDAAGNTAKADADGYSVKNAENGSEKNISSTWLDLDDSGLFSVLYEGNTEYTAERFGSFWYVEYDGGNFAKEIPDIAYDADSNLYVTVSGNKGDSVSVVVRAEEGYAVSDYETPSGNINENEDGTEVTVKTEYSERTAGRSSLYSFSFEEKKQEDAPVKETAEENKNKESEEKPSTEEASSVKDDKNTETEADAAGNADESPADETEKKNETGQAEGSVEESVGADGRDEGRADEGPVIAVDETEKKDAAQAEEKKDGEDKEEKYNKEYRYDDGNVVITAVVTEKGVIPDDAEFVCVPIDEKSEEYAKLRQKMTEYYGVSDDSLEIYPYDISFYVNGEKTEPVEGSVIIRFEMKDPIRVSEEENVSVVHIKENDDAEILSDDIVTKGEIKKFEVEMESFSPVVITRTNIATTPANSVVRSTENGDVWISKTSNIDINGKAGSLYSNNMNVTDTVNIDGAVSLHVDISYGGEGIGCDWLYIKDEAGNVITQDSNGNSVGSTVKESVGKIGGKNLDFSGSNSNVKEPANTVSYDFDTDTLQFTWRTDSSVNGYGYYAVITPVYAQDQVPEFHFEELEDGTYALVFDRPGDINAFAVRPDIKEQIAQYKDSVSEIRLHKGTTSIDNAAFKGFTALKTVTVPRNSQLTKIGKNAFMNCDSLESFNIPAGVTEMSGSAFSGCRGLETVTFDSSNTMTQLPDGLFKNCESLKNVTLPAGLQKVSDSLFDGCTSLADITLPDSVTEIGAYAFRNTKLSDVPSIENITSIGDGAFYGCTEMTEVNIPENVTFIGTSAFEGCSNITDFSFDDGSAMNTLPNRMFSGMTNLKNVKLPGQLEKIPAYCFNNCKNLNTVEIPDTVTEFGDYAFSGCSKLQDFEIPEGVKKLGQRVFSGCTGLKDMTIPNTVTSMGSGTFYNCSNLIKASFEDGSSINPLPQSMFYGCSSLEFVKLPDGVTSIPASYFYGCTSLKHVDLPENLVSIGDSAFYGCYNLETIELPDTLKTIGSSAFYNCDSITEVTVPRSVTSVGNSAWYGCNGLKTAVFEEGSPLTSLGTSIFYGCSELESAVLPSKLTSIPTNCFRECTKLSDVEIPDRVTIIGSSSFQGCKALKTIDLPASVTQIYSSAFAYSGLEEIDLPDNLTSIGSSAFRETNLKEVEIPNKVTSVGNDSFYGNTKLESVKFEDGGSSCVIKYRAFSGCPALKDVELKEGITSIEYEAFYNDRNIQQITIPSTVTSIGNNAFYGNKGAKKLEFTASSANKALYIASSSTGNVFANLTNVEEVVVDRDVTSSYKSTNNFSGINPDAKFVIGKHVNTLDNMIVSCFTEKTEIVFEGENDFTVSNRIDNTSEDVKWSELKGDFYADDKGVLYKLNKNDNTASVFYIPKGIEEYTVPETITSVAGQTYNVTMIESYAVRSADDLASLVFEAPSAVTIPQFAFTGCSSLQTINGKDEIYREDWESVSSMCGFPIHEEPVPEQVLMLHDTIELGGEGGEAQAFSFGVSITGQEKMADDGLTYVYPTGMGARLDFAISNESNFDMSDRVIRVYFAFDGDNYTMGNYVAGHDYTMVNTATGARYPLKVRATDAKGVYYYDLSGFKPGDTLAFNNQFSYMSPKSAGGTMRVWVESITAQEAQEREGKVSEPGKYILADWYTQPVPYNITKKVNGNPTFEFTANQQDEDDDNIYVKNLQYQISMTSSGESGTSYAKDYVKYIDFYDDVKLKEGMIWNPKVIEAVRAGDYYADSGNYVYARIDGKWVQIFRMSFSSNECVRGISCEVVKDENNNDAVRIRWSYRNTYWTDTKTAPTADMPATNYYLYFGDRSICVKRGEDLWNMLREGEEFSEEESREMREIANKVTETTHYSFSEDLTKEAEAEDRLVYATAGFSMKKEMTGRNYFGEEHAYAISLINSGLIHKDDIDIVEDSLREHYYIESKDIESMLRDEKWGPYVRIDITSATLCRLPDADVIDIYGNHVSLETAQQSGIEPIPYSGTAAAGTDISETTTNAKLALYWNEDRSSIVLDVADDSGAVQNSYLIGPGKDYVTVQEALDSIGYEVTFRAAYKVTWDLGDSYTLYNAKKSGIEVSAVSELTDEQRSAFSYRLKSGRTDVFRIPSRVKKTMMWLTQDEPGHYPSNSISSSNTAYAKSGDGRQIGSAGWTGTLYRELSLSKTAYADGKSWSSNISIPDDTVVDYTLSFTNSGETYDVLPLVDKMGGSQMLLVPVRNNKTALYYDGTGDGTELQSAGLDTYTDGGVQYYILDKAGLYKGVTIDGRIADSISVVKNDGYVTTLIKWYYQDVTGYSANTSSITRSVSYKALADSTRAGGRTEDETGSTVTRSGLANETWLGGHQTHRLYDSLYGGIEQLQFIKWIVEDPEASRENLIRHSLVQDGDNVVYKFIIRNTGDSEVTLTGNHLHDELPTTSGIFAWSKDNVTDISYVTEGLGTSVTTTGPEYWYINSLQPGTGADTASRGLYYIYWNNDFKIHFDPRSEIWIYVTLKFPGSQDTDPETGESDNKWDSYITKNNGAIITNSFFIDQRYSSVTHELVDVVEGKLQKGVLDTGLSRSGYFQSEDTRHFYQNGGNTDNGSVQEVAYYTVIYNSGNVRLYLDPLRDQLPKGFIFRGLINCIPKAAETSSGFDTSYSSSNYNTLGSYYNGFNTIRYTENRTGNSSYIPLASVSDENRQSIVYKNAQVTAATAEDTEGHQQVTFTLSRYTNNDSYLKYDSTLGKYYLDPGEAVRFGYLCTVQGYARTENMAVNEIAMPVYDKYGLGVRTSGEDVTVEPAVYREIAVNDGGCDKTSTEEETDGRRHEKSSWVRGTTEWLSSNVSLQRLAPVPGILKTVGGETYIASNVTIRPDQVYGSKYTDGNKGGSPYVGTVSRTSVVNWALRVYNEGGTGSNSMEDYWIVDTVDSPYQFTGNYFYDYYNVNGTKMTSSSVPVFSLGGRSEDDTTVKISTGQGGSTLTLDGTITVNGAPVSVDGGRAEVQLLMDETTKVETLKIHMKDNYHRIPPNSYMMMYAHTQYTSNDAVLSKQFYNHVQLEPSEEFDPALVSQGKVLYRDESGDQVPYAIESGASVTMTAGYTSAARKQVTELGNTSNTGWSDKTKNYIRLPEKYSQFYYDLYVDLPKDDPTSKLVMIDTLPEPGDHSPFVERDMRDSEFVVHMLSENLGLQVWSSPNLGTGTKVPLGYDKYTFEVSERREFEPEDWEGGGDGWNTIDMSDGLSETETQLIENARSFRLIIDDPNTVADPAHCTMGKNYQVQVRFNAELMYPEDADPGAIAWNSFGYRYTVPIGATGIYTSLNAEPLKVGVMIPSVPIIIKDQKTPHNHYKPAAEDEDYTFLVYSGPSITGLNDITGMTEEEIAGILSENSRDILIKHVTIRAGESTGDTGFLDEEKKWIWNGNGFEETQENWIWENAKKYTVMELPWDENGFVFDNIRHSPVNNYTFTQTSDNNVSIRVTNVYDRKGNLKVSKTVNGPSFDPDRRFTFSIHLQDGRYPVYGTYDYIGTNIRSGSLTFDDEGNAVIQLKHGQAIELQDIPADYTYSVTESEDPWYSQHSTNADGSIVHDTTQNADFVNTRKDTTLSVKKTVTGNMGSRTQLFDFDVYITDEGKELTGKYTLTVKHEDGTENASEINFEEGAAVIRIGHGDTGVISGLPVGARYEVDELGAEAMGYTVTYENERGVLTETGAVTEWTNRLSSVLPTGIDGLPAAAVIAVIASLAAVIVYKRKKKV